MAQIFECSGPERDRRNQRRIILWSLAWAVVFVIASHGLKEGWLDGGWATALAIAVPAVLGAGTALAYRRFLHEADELRRKIELEALALAFAVGAVGGLTYWLFELAGLVEQAELPYLVALMLLAHPIGTLVGQRRYS